MSTTVESYLVVGPRGEKLYPSPQQNPAKNRNLGTLPRDMRRAIRPIDWADMVTLAAKLAAGDPELRGAIRQRAEWAFAGDSWQPIYYGENEQWGDIATDWLTEVVFKDALRQNPRKDLIKAMQVSAMDWAIHGGDLALFSLGAGNMPKMTIVPGTRIGNGMKDTWSGTVTGGVYSAGGYDLNGFGICQSGRYDGYRIYNGFIFDDFDEVIAVRVLGWKRENGKFVESFSDFDLGFQHGTHFASEYDWHGLGRPLPKYASSLVRLQQIGQIDEDFILGIQNAARQTVAHKLAPGQDAVSARGNTLTPVTIPAESSASGQEEVLYVEYSQAGDTKYIAADEDLTFLDYKNPHPNVEDFAQRLRSGTLLDLGWPYELTDLSSTGRGPTRVVCELANNSLWQTQCTGEARLYGFVKYAIAVGIQYKHIPPHPSGRLTEPYLWTFGYPKEMSVDAGNDVTASLNRLRFGLTSQRIESAKWGYVLKRVRRDRQKEVLSLLEDADLAVKHAKAMKHDLPFLRALELFYQPSANGAAIQNTNPTAEGGEQSGKQKVEAGERRADEEETGKGRNGESSPVNGHRVTF
jgi:hypothetical protein